LQYENVTPHSTPHSTPRPTPTGIGSPLPYAHVPLDGGATPSSDYNVRRVNHGKPPRGPTGDSNTSFSTRLATVTASTKSGAARLADIVAARRARQVRRYKGGRFLLKQLQEDTGSKDPSVLAGVLQPPPKDPRYVAPTIIGAMKAKLFGPPPSAEQVQARTEIGDPDAIKRTVGYKMRALRRRTEQQLLVSMGTKKKRPDEEFEHLWARVQRQEQLLHKIQTDGARYAKAMAEMSAAAECMVGHITELTEEGLNISFGSGRQSGDGGMPLASGGQLSASQPTGSGGGGSSWSNGGSGHASPARGGSPSGSLVGPVVREAVMARARQLSEVMHTLETEVRPRCVERLSDSVTAPATAKCLDFPSYQPCIDKRRSYILDMDAYERKLEATREKARVQTRDPAEVPYRERQFQCASQRYTQFSDKLVNDLSLLDSSRFEVAGEMLEGFVETHQFMLERQSEAMRVMRTTPH